MSSDLEKKAKTIHRHSLRIRNYMLRGRMNMPESKEPCKQEPTFPQIKAMLMLHMSGPSTLKSFAGALDISHPSASQMVDRLVEMNMVTRLQDPDDRRRVVIDLTEMSRQYVEAHENSIVLQITNLMNKMDPKYVDTWVELAEHISEVLAENPDLGIPQEEPKKS